MGRFRRFFCDYLGWHSPIKQRNFDGCSWQSWCRFCARYILRDSQGNWFAVERGEYPR